MAFLDGTCNRPRDGTALAVIDQNVGFATVTLILGNGHYVWIQELEGGKPASRHIAEKILAV